MVSKRATQGAVSHALFNKDEEAPVALGPQGHALEFGFVWIKYIDVGGTLLLQS